MPYSSIGYMETRNRPLVLPAAGGYAGILSDSISDQTVGWYGGWYEAVCQNYGWIPINTNLGWNGSFELDAQDAFAEGNCTITWSADTAWHGSKSLKITASTTGQAYASMCGAVPPTGVGIMSGTAPNQTVTGLTVNGVSAGIASPQAVIGGGGTGGLLSLAINSAGTIVSCQVTANGTGYPISSTTIPVTINAVSDTLYPGVHGSGATINATSNASGIIVGYTIISGGSGYTPSPLYYFYGVASTTTASAIAYINNNGQSTGCFFTSNGSGYSAAPTAYGGVIRPKSYTATVFNSANQGFVPGNTYMISGHMFNPTSTGISSTTNMFLSLVSGNAAGSFTIAQGSPSVATINAWVPVSLVATVPLDSVAVWVRGGALSASAGQSVYADAIQIRRVPAGTLATAAPTTYSDYFTRGGIASSTLTNINGAGISAQNNMAVRVTQHTQMNILFIQYCVNDLAGMSASAGTPVTLANIRTAFDTVYTAIAAMTPAPKVVALGLFPFSALASWGALPPAGFSSYYAAANAIDAVIEQKASQYGALYIPVRSRMNQLNLLNGTSVPYTVGVGVSQGDVHPTVTGQQVIAQMVIDALEGRY